MDWFLKKKNGEVFGPIEQAVLQLWAAGGRIAPDDQVSSDQKTWRPAVEVPELGLDWMVELEGGALYGPFHLLALGDLIRDGSVPTTARIIHRITGNRHILHEALVLAVLEQNTRLAATVQELHAEVETAQASQDQLQKERAAAEGEQAQRQEDRTRLTQELNAAKLEHSRLQDTLSGAQSEQARLQQELDALKGERARLQEDHTRLTQAVDAAKREHDQLHDELKQRETRLADAAKNTDQLQHQLAELQKDQAALKSAQQAEQIQRQQERDEAKRQQAQLHAGHTQLTQALDAAKHEQSQLHDELKRRETRLADAAKNADQLQHQLAELQKDQAALKSAQAEQIRLQQERDALKGEQAHLHKDRTHLTQELSAAKLAHDRLQDELKQHTALQEDAAQKAQQLRQLILELQKENNELKAAQDATPDARPNPTTSEWKDMAGKRDFFEKETNKWKRMYADLHTASQKREGELAARIEQLRHEDLAVRTQLEEVQRSSRKLEQTLKQIGDTTVFHTDAEAAAAQRAALFDAYNELSRRCETLMDQLDAKSLEVNDVMQSHARSQEEAEHRLQTMESHLAKEREEADRARKRALQLEEDHIQLLRSFRDLNDRYIRLRQVAGHVPSAEHPWPPPQDIAKKNLPPKP